MPHEHPHCCSNVDLDHATKKEKKAFYFSLYIALFFMVVEVIGGLVANSLALISDALHLFTDAGSLILAIVVVYLMRRPSTKKKSFGYQRAEILGALFSGSSLWILSFFLIFEAGERLVSPPEVKGPIVFVIAVIGLVANFFMIKILHPGEKGSLNMKAAYLHVLGDFLGSFGVILSGLLIWWTHWSPIDSICTILFSLLILYSSGKMMKEAVDVLMESTPKGISAGEVCSDLLNLPGIKEVHDLHIWNVSTKMVALSAHLVGDLPKKTLLQEAHEMLQKKYGIYHTTLQVEASKDFQCNQCFDCQKNWNQ